MEATMTDGESPRLLGLASASMAGAFVTNETVISLLYDAMTVSWNNGGAEPKHMPSTRFAIVASPAARGQSIRLSLNGFTQPAGAGALAVQVGGTQLKVEPDEEDYVETVTVTLSADADTTPVTVTLDLPEPADDSAAMVGLDSIDISLTDCPGG
jgi:hypothetical protein